MSIDELKARLADIPGIETLTMTALVGRHVYGWAGLIAGVDPSATPDEVEHAIRTTAILGKDTDAAAPNPSWVPATPAEINDLARSGMAAMADFRATSLPTVTLVPDLPADAPSPAPAILGRAAIAPKAPPPAGSFAASIRAMMDKARAGVAQARADGLARVGEAIGKLNDAQAATAHVAGSMAKTIEDEASSVMSELAQISNDLGV